MTGDGSLTPDLQIRAIWHGLGGSAIEVLAEAAGGGEGVEDARDDLIGPGSGGLVRGLGLEELRVDEHDPQQVVQPVEELVQDSGAAAAAGAVAEEAPSQDAGAA